MITKSAISHSISRSDLAFAYEMYCEGFSWKFIERHSGYQRSTIIKSLRRSGACMSR